MSAHKGPAAPAGGAAYSFTALFLSENALHNELCIILYDCSGIEMVRSRSIVEEIKVWAQPL